MKSTEFVQGGLPIFVRDSIGYLFYIPVYEVLTRRMHEMGAGESVTQVIRNIFK